MARQSDGQMDRAGWGCDMAGRDLPKRSVSRRCFLRGGALALVGTSAIPAFLTRSVLGEVNRASSHGQRLVVLFQRGAVDGLNMIVPFGEPNYYSMRPTIAIQAKEVVDLDGFFGLHPAMAALAPLYKQGHLAVVHAAGSPDTTRSHFDAQDYMESGTPGVKATPDGWLNRALRTAPAEQPESAFRAVAMGAQLPRTLEGSLPAVALSNLADFSVGGRAKAPTAAAGALEAMYDGSSDTVLHGTGEQTFEAVKMLRAADPAKYQPAPGVNYPRSPLGDSLRQIAQLMKSNLGVEAAFADVGGWDTHQNQGAAQGQLASRLSDFADSIAAFWRDLGDDAANTTLVTMSEFGRTARQNGTGGTDHGHANAMLVLGGAVRGGKVYGRWPGLAPEQLNEGRDLVVSTDYRRVLAELAQGTLGSRNLGEMFPGAGLDPRDFLQLLSRS